MSKELNGGEKRNLFEVWLGSLERKFSLSYGHCRCFQDSGTVSPLLLSIKSMPLKIMAVWSLICAARTMEQLWLLTNFRICGGVGKV